MDPWLEDPALWPNLHHLLITATNSHLKRQLHPRGYLVTIGERVWVTEPHRVVYPDVAVVERPQRAHAAAAIATILEADEPVRVKVAGAEIREPYLEILDAHDERLVTAIEFLSPANKSPGRGRELYIKKQQETLGSQANLVEVDLLRSGPHTVAVPAAFISAEWNADYLVCIARSSRGDEYELYPIGVQSRLPRVGIPLKPGDADGVLDLQAVLDQAYDEGPFADRVDYATEPFGKISAGNRAWCDELLRSKGLRVFKEDSS